MMFRRQALRQLEAPEQLDTVVRLATVPGWLLTVALALAIGTAGAWSVLDTVDRTVRANGVLIHAGGISRFDATTSGQVVKVWISSNQRVAKGTPVYTAQTSDGVITIEAPWDAHVVSVSVSEGALVQPGTRVAEMERLDAPGDALQAVVFIRATSAPLLRPGTEVGVQVAAAPANVFGTLEGEVSTIGLFPETEDSLRAFLGSAVDVRSLLAAGSVVRITVPLTTDPSSPNGLKWSKAPPPFQLNSASQISAIFTIARERPIDWLLG